MHPNKDVHAYPLNEELVLFAESSGRLYRANATAAMIWQGIVAGLNRDDIETLMSEAYPVDPNQITSDLDMLLNEWQTLGLLENRQPSVTTSIGNTLSADPYLKPVPPPAINPVDSFYQILDSRVMLRLPGDKEASQMHPILAHLQSLKLSECNLLLEVRKSSDHYVLLHDNLPIDWCDDIRTVAPMVHGNMQLLVYGQANCLIGLHAAAVVLNDFCILMPAPSGSGKSTLTSALVGSGFCYCSDDLVLLTHDPVKLRPAPTAMGLKKGAWSILAPYHSGLTSLTTYIRNDSQHIRYLPPPVNDIVKNPATKLTVSHIVFPGYRPVGQAIIRSVTPAEGLLRITEAGYDIHDGLSADRVEQMINWIANIPCFELHYNHLQEAVDALEKFLGKP